MNKKSCKDCVYYHDYFKTTSYGKAGYGFCRNIEANPTFNDDVSVHPIKFIADNLKQCNKYTEKGENKEHEENKELQNQDGKKEKGKRRVSEKE